MFDVVRKSAIPLGDQLVERVTGLIESGRLPEGSRLPSVRQLARRVGVEDHVYTDLAPRPAVSLAQIDELKRVLYVGSSTKKCWARACASASSRRPMPSCPNWSIRKFWAFSPGPRSMNSSCEMLASGKYRKHTERLRDRLATARAASANALRRAGLCMDPTAADGIFLWCRLPAGIDSERLCADARAAASLLAKGAMFSIGGRGDAYLRMNAAYGSDPALAQFLESSFGAAAKMPNEAAFEMGDLESAAALVRRVLPPTPQYAWPKLKKRAGCTVWVKHENHTPTGAFKVRGGLVYLDRLHRSAPTTPGVISATRGNHGQSIAFAAARAGIPATIYVPHNNSLDQNSAIAAFGARVIEFGKDFDEARHEAFRVAAAEGLHFIPSFHRDLVTGVATYALELFRAVGALDAVYVGVGMGSGISGLITVRDLLGLKTEIIGVCAAKAPATALSFATGRAVHAPSAQTFADGVATREPKQGHRDDLPRSGAHSAGLRG